jgi:hypothetical protein
MPALCLQMPRFAVGSALTHAQFWSPCLLHFPSRRQRTGGHAAAEALAADVSTRRHIRRAGNGHGPLKQGPTVDAFGVRHVERKSPGAVARRVAAAEPVAPAPRQGSAQMNGTEQQVSTQTWPAGQLPFWQGKKSQFPDLVSMHWQPVPL